MKHKLFILCCFFMLAFGSKHVSAQVAFDVKDIDWIVMEDDGDLYFVEQRGKRFRKIDVDFYELTSKKQPKITKGKWTTTSLIDSTDKVINVKDIKPYSPKAMYRHLAKYQFKSTETDDGDTTLTYLQLFNPYWMLIADKEIVHFYDTGVADVKMNYDMNSFCILKLRGNKSIVLFWPEDYPGYYIPGKKKDLLFVEDYNFQKRGFVTEKADRIWNTDDDLRQIFAVIRSSIDNDLYYYIDKTEDGKKALLGEYGENLLAGKYDTIERGGYFILATKNEQTDIYNFLLKRIAKVRSYTTNAESMMLLHILKGDSVYTIDYRGVLNPKKSYSDQFSFPVFHPSHNHTSMFQGTKKTHDNYYVFTQYSDYDYSYYNFKANNRIQLPEGVTPDDVYNEDYFSKDDCRQCETTFYLKKNAHIGLYFIKFPSNPVDRKIVKEISLKIPHRDTVYQGSPVIAKELIPITMDSLKAVDYGPKRKQLLMYKEDMVGVYPFQSEPKYRSINPKPLGGFLRYILPDGRKGWLNLQTGKEFLDE